jgi:hypothetical protein
MGRTEKRQKVMAFMAHFAKLAKLKIFIFHQTLSHQIREKAFRS